MIRIVWNCEKKNHWAEQRMYIYARNSSQSLTKKFHFVCWLNKMYFSLRFHKENENYGKFSLNLSIRSV